VARPWTNGIAERFHKTILTEQKQKLKVLIDDYKFRFPMSSAILSLLYPDNFTIYVVRVCDTLTEFKGLDKITSIPTDKMRITTSNTCMAIMVIQYSADTFVVIQSLVLRINICGENCHLRQAQNR
jgi:hypothetical protein